MSGMKVNKIHPKPDNTVIANFIQATFHGRECIRFYEAEGTLNNNESVENATADGNAADRPGAESICSCGYIKTAHRNKAVGAAPSNSTSKAWNVEEDTRTFPTNAHGKIEFDETEEHSPFNKPTVKRFIRLDYKVNLDKILELFDDKWKMDEPQLFLSIISNETRRKKDQTETNEMRKRREAVEKFCEKLVEAATQTNAWIITEGVMEGIGGIVGDKIEKIVDEKGKRPIAVLSICNWGCIRDKHRLINKNIHNSYIATHSICSKCDGEDAVKEFSLDRNHSAFVLVDDGRQFQPGCERSVRQKLELKLREYQWKEQKERSSNKHSIPLIYFLIGGNVSDLQSVERALANEIPVIIAKGTGGAADLIAEVVSSSEEVKIERIAESLDRPITKDSNDIDRIRYNFRLIQKNKEKLLLLFDTTEENYGSQHLSLRILTALKVSMKNPTNIFMLAAEWDNKIFFKGLLREKPEGSDLEDVMCNLLLKGNHSYVEVLLGNGVNLEKVAGKIPDLKWPDLNESEIVSHLMNQTTSRGQAEVDSKIVKCLCLWSASQGMSEMAKVFWREGKDYLAMALMAYKVSKDEKKKLRGTEKRKPMREQMKMFQTLSTNFLLNCDTDNRPNTITLLRSRVRDLKDQTPMQIALESDSKEFVAQPSFQELLNQISTKRIIDHSKYKYLPLSVAILCPFAAPGLFEYRDAETYKKGLGEHSPTMRSFLYYFWKFRSFLDAPAVKFIYNTLSYLAYLVLFSIVMLTDFRTTMSPSEIALTIWTFILIIEECRQVAIFSREYLNKWNVLDVLALTLYVIGFIPRIVHQSLPSTCPECLYVARIILSFSLLIAILRVLQLLAINRVLGPKIYMIGRLIRDMVSFMLIMAIFISAYGVASNVILYPNQPLNATLLQDVFYDAWWSIIQQFNREDALGLNCNLDDPSPDVSLEYCSSPTDLGIDYEMCKKQKCPANTWLVSVLLAFYALLTCIMMLNVLIAMFNVSFTKVEEKQNRVSRMQRYRLIREYNFRSMIPAPLCVFAYLKYVPQLCRLCRSRCFCQLGSSQNMFGLPLEPEITIWEERMREKYEEEIRIRQLSEIATMVPRGNVYGLILNTPDYVNKIMQTFMTKIDQRLLLYVRNPARRDNEESTSAVETKDASTETETETERKETKTERKETETERKETETERKDRPQGRDRSTDRIWRPVINRPPKSDKRDDSKSTLGQVDLKPEETSRTQSERQRDEIVKSIPLPESHDKDASSETKRNERVRALGRSRSADRIGPSERIPPEKPSKFQRDDSISPRRQFDLKPREVSTSGNSTLNLGRQFDLKPREDDLKPETHSKWKKDESVYHQPESHEEDPMPSRSTSPSDQSNETNSTQGTSTDNSSSTREHKKQKTRVVKSYPGRYSRPKPKRSKCMNPNCTMIVRCRDGRTIEFKQPFSKPVDWSRVPGKKALVARVHFKCEECENSGRLMDSADLLREIFHNSISPD